MPDLVFPFVLAQDAAPAAPAAPGGGSGGGDAPSSPGGFPSWPMFVLIFVIFYVLMIRPQSKERKKREAMLSALKKRDRCVTTAGIHGEVIEVDEKTVLLEVADGVRMRFDRGAVWQIVPKEGEAPAEDAKAGGEKKGKA